MFIKTSDLPFFSLDLRTMRLDVFIHKVKIFVAHIHLILEKEFVHLDEVAMLAALNASYLVEGGVQGRA